MQKTIKRYLALFLCLVMALGIFTACGEPEATEPTAAPTQPQPPEEAGVLKVLTLGHSLAVDCGHMLALIAATEGYENFVVGTLYESGCSITEHLTRTRTGEKAYDLYLSNTDEVNLPPSILAGMSIQEALEYDYWDIVIMQGGVFEMTTNHAFKSNQIQGIQEFVREHNQNPNTVFAWHMPWVAPADNTLRDKYPHNPNTYYTNYEAFNHDRTTLFNTTAGLVKEFITTDDTFSYVIPSGTAIENALSSYLEETDLHRDYVHASDLGRVIASYTWFCVLTGVEKLEEIKLTTIPKVFMFSTSSPAHTLTEMEKKVIIESVNNALANPLQMTQSQYTQAG